MKSFGLLSIYKFIIMKVIDIFLMQASYLPDIKRLASTDDRLEFWNQFPPLLGIYMNGMVMRYKKLYFLQLRYAYLYFDSLALNFDSLALKCKTRGFDLLDRENYNTGRVVKILSGHPSMLKIYMCKFSDLCYFLFGLKRVKQVCS